MTFNGVMTADAQYLCCSWASCTYYANIFLFVFSAYLIFSTEIRTTGVQHVEPLWSFAVIKNIEMCAYCGLLATNEHGLRLVQCDRLSLTLIL